MAKSLRSKSLRKNKAVLCQKIFKPTVDARIERLALKEKLVSIGNLMMVDGRSDGETSTGSNSDVTMAASNMSVFNDSITEKNSKKKSGKVSRKHGKHIRSSLNAYGIPAKELFF